VKSETPEMNHSRFELVLILKFEMEMDVERVDVRESWFRERSGVPLG
jgi:hypothetical protein